MSRRRTGTRYVPITISLKPSMVDEIEAKLSPKQSRSQWISDAITDKLLPEIHSVDKLSTNRVLSELRSREDITGEMRGIIEYWLSQR
jgi:metal-responsive CopG/Arc/MetJ family transcriptional regulator